MAARWILCERGPLRIHLGVIKGEVGCDIGYYHRRLQRLTNGFTAHYCTQRYDTRWILLMPEAAGFLKKSRIRKNSINIVINSAGIGVWKTQTLKLRERYFTLKGHWTTTWTVLCPERGQKQTFFDPPPPHLVLISECPLRSSRHWRIKLGKYTIWIHLKNLFLKNSGINTPVYPFVY